MFLNPMALPHLKHPKTPAWVRGPGEAAAHARGGSRDSGHCGSVQSHWMGGNNASNRDQCHILRSRLGDARWCFFWLATLPAGSCWHHGPRGWQTAGCGEHGQDSNAGDERQHCAYFRRIRMVGEIYSVRRSGIRKILLGFCGYIFFKPPMYMFICT